jgi:hypothetical protein
MPYDLAASWKRFFEIRRSIAQALNSPTFIANKYNLHYAIILLKLFFVIVLFLGMISLPRWAADGTHDFGSQLIFEVHYVKGTKFGTDVIQNIGPYGFLSFPFTYGGFAYTEKIIYNFFFTFIFACMVLWTVGHFKGIIFRIFFVATISFFFYETETSTYVFFLMAACLVMTWPRSRSALILKIAVVPLLAFLALTKAIFLFCSLFLICLGCLRFSYNKRHDISLVLILVYAISLAALWFLAGQGAGNFIPFVVNALRFSSIYNEAMTVYEPVQLTVMGAVLVSIIGVRLFLLFVAGLRQRDFEAISAAMFFSLVTVLTWKHGFVRSLGHMPIFFFSVLAAAPLLILARFDCERNESWLWSSAKIILFLAILALGTISTDMLGIRPVPITQQAMNNLRLLPNLSSSLDALEQQLQTNKITERLNDIKQTVGNETIDNFGITPGAIAMNDLNYHGRPMAIRFMSLGATFEEKNAAFYRDAANAPHYVLMTDGEIDGRFLAQDDALAFLELLANYRVALIEKNTILFKRRADHVNDIGFVPLSEMSARFGETLPIPQDKGRYVWACVDIRSTLLGSLYSKLYKSPQINIRLLRSDNQGSGWPKVYKFISVKGGSCFLVAPLISTNWEFVLKSLSDSERINVPGQSAGLLDMVEPDGMQFFVNHRQGDIFFQDNIQLRFFEITGIPEQSIPPGAVTQRLFTFDRLPIRVDAAAFTPLLAYGKPVSLVHAPARVDFAKPAGLGKLAADFGMLPSAFESGSASDGVTISVTFTSSASGETSALFERTLDPVKVEADRGVQKLALELPRDEAGTVSIVIGMRTHMGWDHSFLANVAFMP